MGGSRMSMQEGLHTWMLLISKTTVGVDATLYVLLKVQREICYLAEARQHYKVTRRLKTTHNFYIVWESNDGYKMKLVRSTYIIERINLRAH